ncbi:hypothetical protein BN1708_015104 [Verticillium longisporum]|uniref:Uncharacterized protein n=1 Tax=Verticillium longisporum TaxID=100787 RepID=A0A0G4M2K4_VERLO|nr:hypothetical protein BN1708_015104 [Verticillium longisporum]
MSLESKKSDPPAPPPSPSVRTHQPSAASHADKPKEQDKTNTYDPAISDLDDVVEKANEKDE